MKRQLILIVLVILSFESAFAHNPRIASFTLRDAGIGWYLEMSFARSAVDAEMIDIHGEELLTTIEKEEYQRFFMEYVYDHIHIVQDGEVIELGAGGIRLGNHQTDLKFPLRELTDPHHLDIAINLFEDEHNQVNLFRIYRGGESLHKVFLSEDNDFKTSFRLNPDGGVIQVDNTNASARLMPTWIIALVTIGLLFGLLAILVGMKAAKPVMDLG